MAATRRVSSADGTTLAVYESGEPGRPTLVAVHGYPDNHSVWDGVVAELEKHYRVVTYDVRGAGESDKPAGRSAYLIARLVEDLAAVLDAVSPGEPAHLLAHDWGSIQVWDAVTDERFTARLASFTSISGPSLDQAGVWMRGARRHPRAAARQLLHSYYTLLFQLPVLPEAAWRSGLLDALMAWARTRRRSAVALDTEPQRSASDKINGLQLYRANMFARLGRPRPRGTDIPVQVIAPRDDIFVCADLQTQAPAPYVRDLRTRILAGGHWIVSDRPDVIVRCVTEFVEHVEGSPETSARQALTSSL